MTISHLTTSFHIAIIQHPPVLLNLEQSVLKACSLIEEAANHKRRELCVRCPFMIRERHNFCLTTDKLTLYVSRNEIHHLSFTGGKFL